MFSSPWIRTPDYPATGALDYSDYWATRGWEVLGHLRPRENVMLARIPTGARVIDIGCGTSRLPVALHEKGVAIEVADVSPKVLEGYKQYGIIGHELDLEQCDFSVLEGRYDYIILSEVLEHTRNPEEIISKLAPYTNHFLITVPNSAAYMFRYGLLVRGRFCTQWVMHPSEHLRYWSHIDFLDWLAAMGLEVLESPVSDGFSFRGRAMWLPRLWKNLLGFRMVYVCKTKP